MRERKIGNSFSGPVEFMAPAIVWPEKFQPGFVDNFVSNEVVAANLTAQEVWPYLGNPYKWSGYYRNAGDIYFYDGYGPVLQCGSRFRFRTFDFLIEAEVTEFQEPGIAVPGRLAWHGWAEGDEESRFDVHHAWLLEDLSGKRVRILTQEAQIGKPAQKMAGQLPNPMLNAHQEWLTGLVKAAGKK